MYKRKFPLVKVKKSKIKFMSFSLHVQKVKFSFDSSGHKFGRPKDFRLINIFLTQIINKIMFARES